jgi:hypothetical protein
MARHSIGFVLYTPYYPHAPRYFSSIEEAGAAWDDDSELREVVGLRTKDYDRACDARKKEA